MIVFGVFEVLLGIMILFPKLQRPTFILIILHLFTTVLPLFILPSVSWEGILIPTILGQYIMKALSDLKGGGKALILGLCVAFIGLAVDNLIRTWEVVHYFKNIRSRSYKTHLPY